MIDQKKKKKKKDGLLHMYYLCFKFSKMKIKSSKRPLKVRASAFARRMG